MPIYEYKCKNCNHSFEELQKIDEKSLTICPKCGKNKLKKLVSMTHFRLKGTGWYETDFKTKEVAKNEAKNELKEGKIKETKIKDKSGKKAKDKATGKNK